MNDSSYEIRSINDYDQPREELGGGKTNVVAVQLRVGALSHGFRDALWQPGLNRPVSNLEPVQLHQSWRDVRLAWHHEDRLAESALLQHHENSARAPDVQLREWVV